MTTGKHGLPERARGSDIRRAFVVVAIIVGSMICSILLARWNDSRRPAPDLQLEEESLYLTGNTLRRASLSFNGLAADWYWMRSLQYVGHKFLKTQTKIQLDDLGQLNLKLLAPLLDTTTTLDPEFMEPYEYAAVVLPAVDVQQAIRITKKGIQANPSRWRLYQHLGYIYWQQKDFRAASDVYGRGATVPGAPPWMEAMQARMVSEGGSRDLAREIYRRMYEQAEDNKVKEMAWLRLMQLDSFDQRDALRKVLSLYEARAGRCPSSWKELEPVFRASRLRVNGAGAPLDPSGTAYVLVSGKCDVDLDPKSDVPQK